MSLTLPVAALLMGVVGGPHCAAMCGAACAGITRAGAQGAARRMWTFQLGRLLGYSAAGAASAAIVGGLVALSSQTAALRPVWMLFHLAVLAWGLALLTLARQPMWAASAARSLWARVRPAASRNGAVLTMGAAWALMPCGLLYSALLTASLASSAWEGALAMALFGVGSGASLGAFPWLLARSRRLRSGAGQDWGTRLAGLLLVATASWALTADVVHRVLAWCGVSV